MKETELLVKRLPKGRPYPIPAHIQGACKPPEIGDLCERVDRIMEDIKREKSGQMTADEVRDLEIGQPARRGDGHLWGKNLPAPQGG
jgi:hypothetical protein